MKSYRFEPTRSADTSSSVQPEGVLDTKMQL
jgi:hypothetical protein